MITADQYFKHKESYPHSLTPDVYKAGLDTIEKVNRLLAIYIDATGADIDDYELSSGWRPEIYNRMISNAAPRSNHVKGKAADVKDPEGALDEWCMDNLNILEEIGLWMEHPAATKGWCHLQTVPPRSGRRVFYP